MQERQVKGAVIIGYMKFIKKTWGQDGLDEYHSESGIETEIHEGKWYDDDYSKKSISWIAENKGHEYLERCGKYTVKDLGMLSYIVRFMDIKSILARGPESYRDAFNYGTFTVDIGDKSATIRLTDNGIHDQYACPTWLGVFKGMLELTNTTGTVKEVQCERDGAEHCEFLMEWT